jgi:hypothetical protein
MKNFFGIMEILVCLFFCSAGFSEDAINALPLTGSPRSFAMGGTCIAMETGANALFGNPAGLGEGNRCEMLIGHTWQISKTLNYREENIYIFRDVSNSFSYDPAQRFNYVGVSFIKKPEKLPFQFGGAVGYGTFYPWSGKYTRTSTWTYGNSSETTENKIIESDRLYDLIRFGLAISREGAGSLGISVNMPFMIKENLDAKTFFRIGGTVKAFPGVVLGAVWQQSHTYTLNDQKRTFPGIVSLGFAVRPVQDLLCTVDLESRLWTRVKIEHVFPNPYTWEESVYLSNAPSGTAYRFGVECGKTFLLRAGYAWDLLPVLDENGEGAVLHHLSMGLGYHSKTIWMDVGIRYRYSDYSRTVEYYQTSQSDYEIREWVLQSGITLIRNE